MTAGAGTLIVTLAAKHKAARGLPLIASSSPPAAWSPIRYGGKVDIPPRSGAIGKPVF